jgi:hypothetical protein
MVVRRRPVLRAAAIGGTFYAGRAMGRRSEQQAAQDQPDSSAENDQSAQNAPAPGAGGQGAPGGPSVLDQLNQLTALHQQGALNDGEFAAAKAKVLGSGQSG